MKINSMYFTYNGEKSTDKGVCLIKLEKGLYEGHFLADKELISETITGNDIPYIYGHRLKPLIIKLVISPLEGKWTTEKRREIATWLDNGKTFNLFKSADDLDKRYYLTYLNSNLYETGSNQGYVTVTFQNIGPFAYTAVYEEVFDLSDIGSSPKTISFNNIGDTDVFPLLSIKKIGDGDFKIMNLSNGGKTFEITSLLDQEEIEVNNFTRQIRTNLSNTNRYSNFNMKYLRLPKYYNYLQVTGAAILTFKSQFAIKG